MGILGLSKLIFDKAPTGVKENEMKAYFGRKVAIDASMSIYQFLIAIRQDGAQLTNEDGEVTSHLAGLFYRTLRMCDLGIKPVWVFDGKPPDMKSGELEKRKERREDAQKKLDAAVEAGEDAEVDKFQRRLVKVSRDNVEECKKLLRLMGMPVVEAPTEAEAQCAQLVTSGKVYAAATEDMDALTFSSSKLLRHMTFSEARKMPIQEFNLDRILQEMEMTQDEFIDLCILLGCDYCDSITGIGPKRAYTLIKEHKSIEEILKHIDTKKYKVPENWLYKEARELFKKPDVSPGDQIELKWKEPDEAGLIEFMCKEKGFNEDRIKNGLKKLLKSRKQSTQGRLDDFFKFKPSSPSVKRKSDGKASKTPGKKVKTENKTKFKRPR